MVYLDTVVVINFHTFIFFDFFAECFSEEEAQLFQRLEICLDICLNFDKILEILNEKGRISKFVCAKVSGHSFFVRFFFIG